MVKSVKQRFKIGDAEHEVELLPVSREGFMTAKFDGIPYEIFLGERSAQDRIVLIDGRPFKVQTESSRRGSHVILVDGEKIQVSLMAARAESSQQSYAKSPAASRSLTSAEQRGRVSANMPGRIVAVKVKALDRVTVGDPMFVLVAMKMENTIVAPTSGIVKEVSVQPGASVNKGEFLATIG